MADSFAKLRNEASVELTVVVPLLESLGYDLEDISPKHPVTFQEGRTGRKHEADFVLFAGPLHNEDTSLVVVEAKSPEGDLDEGRRQAESYTLATRAPILLTCDGDVLELWQLNLARSSDRILSFPVSEIDGRRGELERYLRKEAVIEYCRTVCGRTIVEATADFGRYEDAELRRTLSFDRSIDRRLKNPEKGTVVSSRVLIEDAPLGGVIVAASGIGKTSLSNKLLRSQISLRWRNGSGRIPVHVPLLDLGPDESILDFAAKRLAPYNASVTERSILSVLREQGLTLILDEFDRLGDDGRLVRESEIRLLLRDHVNLCIFVFSRMSAKPALALPTYELDALDEEEKLAVLQARGTAGPATVLHLMPPLLRELCGNPLLLALAVHHYEQSGSFPDRIEQIFRTWLDRTIQSDPRAPVSAAQREAALGVLARERLRVRTLTTEAVTQLTQAGYPPELLDDLVRCDALVVSGGVVSFHHEALADYLRALVISRYSQPGLNSAITTAELEGGSLFPILLMASLDSPDAQSLLWRRLAYIDFATSLEVLRYRANISACMPADVDGLTQRFLDDLREGVATPLDGYFPALRAPILGELMGTDADDLTVVGAVDVHSARYSFVPPQAGVSFDADDLISRGLIIRSVMLAPSGLRLDSGRLLGLQNLRDALFKVIDGRHLSGRMEWTTERLTSRLHYLRNERNIGLAVTAPLSDWQALLAPVSATVVRSVWPSEFLFSIRSVLDDIATLHSNGRDQLADASPRLGQAREQNLDREEFSRALNEHYRRMQLIYREVAEESFAPVLDQLGFCSALPVRWRINVIDRGSPPVHTIQDNWMPVASWDQAGADVEFSTSFTPWEESNYINVREELQRLGRLTKYTAIFGGWRMLSSFYDFNSRTPGTESSPFHDACASLKRDVERLFSEMPSHDRTPSWER